MLPTDFWHNRGKSFLDPIQDHKAIAIENKRAFLFSLDLRTELFPLPFNIFIDSSVWVQRLHLVFLGPGTSAVGPRGFNTWVQRLQLLGPETSSVGSRSFNCWVQRIQKLGPRIQKLGPETSLSGSRSFMFGPRAFNRMGAETWVLRSGGLNCLVQNLHFICPEKSNCWAQKLQLMGPDTSIVRPRCFNIWIQKLQLLGAETSILAPETSIAPWQGKVTQATQRKPQESKAMQRNEQQSQAKPTQAKRIKAKEASKAKQSKAKQSKADQSKANQCDAKQQEALQSKMKQGTQSKQEQRRAKPSKRKQSKAHQGSIRLHDHWKSSKLPCEKMVEGHLCTDHSQPNGWHPQHLRTQRSWSTAPVLGLLSISVLPRIRNLSSSPRASPARTPNETSRSLAFEISQCPDLAWNRGSLFKKHGSM